MTTEPEIGYSISCFPTQNLKESTLFKGLGRATRRGVRKCYKCGIYNGTRGTICKNKQCDAVFRDSGTKRQSNLDAIQLITNSFRHVFSVRVRDVGPDYRGFVQLPLIHAHCGEGSDIFSNVALCFVNSCQRLFDDSILHCHEANAKKASSLCLHIKSALESKSLATGLDIGRDLINCIKVSTEMKEKLWSLANAKEAPFVQKISKYVMAVKCPVTPKHPLGYLHFSFFPRKGRDLCDSYVCSCTELLSSQDKPPNVKSKCLHYYACVCALASNTKVSEDFEDFLSQEFTSNECSQELHLDSSSSAIRSGSFDKFIARRFFSKGTKPRCVSNRILDRTRMKWRKIAPKTLPLQIKIICNREGHASEHQNNEPIWMFTDWLTSVTESINESFEIDNCDTPNTLLFHVPEDFCQSLFDRIVKIHERKYYNIHSNDTFYINTAYHLQSIFDTQKVKLRTEKYLTQNKLCYLDNIQHDECSNCVIEFDLDSTNNGKHRSFVISWVPNVLDVSKLGQLTLQYNFVLSTC